ncbi:MAG: glycosyltransferase [Chthoniobacteraceae bacterium]|jgi:alpha-1,3-rhamnosyltransferase
MNQPPLISIVIPVYNRERLLPATLQSIREQTCRDWECIVVDDGSTDGTLAVANQWARDDNRIRVVSQKNTGPSVARNRGYAETNPGSQYVTFMDGDDVWLPDALGTLLRATEASPEMAGAHGLADFIDEEGKRFQAGEFAECGRKRIGLGEDGTLQAWDLSKPTSFQTLLYRNTVWPPGLLLTRRIYYEKAGLFDPDLVLAEDWDMILRLSRHGSFSFVNQVMLLYRRHSGSISLQSHEINMGKARQLHTKAFRSQENTPEQRAIARRVWREMQKQCMRGKWETVRQRVAEGKYAAAGAAFIRIYVEIHRFLRGHPTSCGL